jgi:hypothetical protein
MYQVKEIVHGNDHEEAERPQGGKQETRFGIEPFEIVPGVNNRDKTE